MSADAPMHPTFTIVFEGLMLFHGGGDGTKTDVAIVACEDGEHQAKLEYPGDAKPLPLAKGDAVRFSLSSAPAATDEKFRKYVVSLDEYTRWGNLHDHVLSPGSQHEGVIARVALPEGFLTIFKTFREQVRLRKWIAADDRCFPRYVLLETPSQDDVTVTIERPGRPAPIEIPLARDGYVIVTNGCTRQGSHFHEYQKLLRGLGWLGSVKVLPESQCHTPDADTPSPISNPDVIEILERRLPLIPNADCGPIKP